MVSCLPKVECQRPPRRPRPASWHSAITVSPDARNFEFLAYKC